MPGRRRWAWSASAVVLCLILVSVESVVALGITLRPPLAISISTSEFGLSGIRSDTTVTTGFVSPAIHVGLVPGMQETSPHPVVILYADPSYPSLYMTPDDVLGTVDRIGAYSVLFHSVAQTVVADAQTLPTVLQANPAATLVMVGSGVIPDFLLSNSSFLLPTWVRGGGTLVWAGGPLAFFEGHASPSGFVYSNLDWQGQRRFVGFTLTDPYFGAVPGPPPSPPLHCVPRDSGAKPTSFQRAFGVAYISTDAGANISQLAAHNGLSLGSESIPTNGSSARTSLAWLPLGSGSVYYFGGAEFHACGGYIPQATLQIAADVASIIASRFLPTLGPSASADVVLSPLGRQVVTLTVASARAGVVEIVRSDTQGSYFFFDATTLA